MYQHNTELRVKENIVAKKLETVKVLKTDGPEPLASIPVTKEKMNSGLNESISMCRATLSLFSDAKQKSTVIFFLASTRDLQNYRKYLKITEVSCKMQRS